MSKLLTIYFTSDTHGYLYPTNFCDERPRPMGLLAMSFPKDGNTLVIDGGDTLQGSPLSYYCHAQGRPLPAAAALNQKGYDFVTLGNHDFNYGRENLRAHLEALNARCLCANVRDLRGELPLEACAIRTLENGLRVGIIGVATRWITLWEKPENLVDFEITDPVEAMRATVERLRPQVDVLVGVYHGGVERDLETGEALSDTDENLACEICERYPFDLLLTGHQHIAMAGKTYRGVHLVQPPCNATAYVKVEMDERRAFHSELCAVPDSAALTPAQSALLSELNLWLDRPIGALNRPLWPEEKIDMALNGSPIADFFNMVQMEISGAQLSCTCLANELRGFDQKVSVRDVVASYAYSNTLVVLEVTGAVLKQALEQCARYFEMDESGPRVAKSFLQPKEAHYNYDYFYGVDYVFDLRRPEGARVTALSYAGKPVTDEMRFTLCMNNYRATGAGDFPFYAECPRVREINTEVSELILDYFTRHPQVTVDPHRWLRCVH